MSADIDAEQLKRGYQVLAIDDCMQHCQRERRIHQAKRPKIHEQRDQRDLERDRQADKDQAIDVALADEVESASTLTLETDFRPIPFDAAGTLDQVALFPESLRGRRARDSGPRIEGGFPARQLLAGPLAG